MALVGNLSISFQANTQSFDAGAARVRAQLGGLRTGAAQAQVSIAGLGAGLLRLGAAAIALEAVRRALAGIVDAGESMRQTTRLMTQLAGSAEEGAKKLAFVRRTATDLGQEFGTLQSSYIQLTAASKGTVLQGALTDQMFKNIARSTAAFGLTTEETQGIFLAFRQILSKGKIDAEDFNQIAERMPGALGIAARALKVTTKEFGMMREAGQLMSSDLSKIAAQMDKELGSKGAEQIDTVSAAWNRLKNAMTGVGEVLDRGGFFSGFAKEALNAATVVAQAYTPSASTAGVPGIIQERQAAFPGAEIVGSHTAKELLKTMQQIQKLRGIEGVVDATLIRAREEALADLNAQYAEQLATLDKIGKLSQVQAQRAKEAGGSPRASTLEAQTLQAEIGSRMEGVTSGMATFDRRLSMGGNEVDIRREKIELLNKALIDLTGILSRVDSQGALSSLSGGTLSTPLKGIAPALWEAQISRIKRLAAQHGVDPALVAAVVTQESGFNPRAVSPAGAQGLMQLMPPTARGLGVSDSFDPEQNISGGTRYLRDLLRSTGGDVPRALARYNAGPGGVAAVEAGRGALPAETRDFVTRVTQNFAQLRGGAGSTAGAGALDTLRAMRQTLLDQVSDVERLSDAESTREGRLGDILAKLQAMKDALRGQEPGTEHIVRLINEFNLRNPASPLGQATQELLKARARELDDIQESTARWERMAADEEQMILGLGAAMRQPPDQRVDPFAAAQAAALRAGGNDPAMVRAAFDAARQQAGMAEGEAPLTTAAERQQQLLDDAQAILALTEAMAAERDQILLTNEELLKQSLARAHASSATQKMALDLQRSNVILRDAAQLSNFVTDSLIDMATGGEISLARLGQSFSRMVLQMLVEASGLRQILSKLFAAGINLAITALSGVQAGGGGVANIDAGSGSASFMTRASGGPIAVGQPYLVGERGAEVIIPTGNGVVLSHAATRQLLERLGRPLGSSGSFTRASGTARGSLSLVARASGGTVVSGQPFLGGEFGPELVMPSLGGAVSLPSLGGDMAFGGMRAFESSGASSGPSVVINGPLIAVQAQDAGSFQRSRGEIEAQGLKLLRTFQRGG